MRALPGRGALPRAGRVAAGDRLRGRARARTGASSTSAPRSRRCSATRRTNGSPTEPVAREHPPRRARGGARGERQQEQLSRETDRRITSEYRMVHRNGRTVWVRDIARLCAAIGESSFWRGVIVDITAEHSAQRALADAHERHRGMVDALPACSYRAERRAMGRWHFVSAQIQSPAGLLAGRVVRRPDPVAGKPPRRRPRAARARGAGADDLPPGTEFVSEYRLRHRSGRGGRRARPWDPDHGRRRGADDRGDPHRHQRRARRRGGRRRPRRRLPARLRRLRRHLGRRADRALPSCQSQNVESVSLNSTLSDLAASRQQVEGLLDGIQKHLEALGTNLRSVSTQLTATDDPAGQRDSVTVAADGIARPDRQALGTAEGSLHPDGLAELHVGDASYDDWDVVARLRRARDRARVSPGAHRPGGSRRC